jgi:HAD superfamily hydrolase (TIGR01458 family)
VPKGLLLDLDGTIYDGDRLIPGAAETVAWARQSGIPHLFVTNTTSKPRTAIVEKLARLGIRTTADQVLSAPAAAAEWLRRQPKGGVALFTTPALRSEFAGLDDGGRYVVIGDMGEAWDFAALNRAFRLLMADPQSVLVALGMTRYWQTEAGLSLDVAPFVVALEHATGKRAVVLGKPAKEFFLAGAAKLGLEPRDVLMVGDDLRVDVEGARGAGLKGALVKTGKFRDTDLEPARAGLVLGSVAELPGRWNAGI